jgi:hypothetical protein
MCLPNAVHAGGRREVVPMVELFVLSTILSIADAIAKAVALATDIVGLLRKRSERKNSGD